MLEQLHIENIAVIEQADIAFDSGFNVLTGETGAGKSMVIDSILAILGERTYRDIIRTGEKKALVSAIFNDADIIASEHGIDTGGTGELLISREIYADGRNVCRVNGQLSGLSVLRSIGCRLLSVHGQHDGQRLLSEEFHMQYLDEFAGNAPLLEEYVKSYEVWSDLNRQLENLRMDDREKNRMQELLKYQIDDIDSAALKSGEDEQLEARRKLLQSSQKILTALNRALQALDGDDQSAGAVALIGRAQTAFSSISSYGEQIADIEAKLLDLRSQAEDACEFVRDMCAQMEYSPDELEAIESRYDLLYRLKKKYGGSVDDILAYREKCVEELDGIVFSEQKEKKLQEAHRKQYENLLQLGLDLTRCRKEAAQKLEERVTAELAGMDMAGVRLFTQLIPAPEPGPSGCDTVRFLLSANLGEEPRPLVRIASGGELSRIMLALQNVLTENDEVQTLIFDEVDAGISGRAAQAVGEKLSSLAGKKQVICVTHLPRIASFGSAHFLIEKGTREGRTYTNVKRLNKQERIRDIARMTGGSHLSKAALENAEEMLRSGGQY